MSFERTSEEVAPERRHTASIARSISLQFAWRRLLGWVLLDVFLVVVAAIIFDWFATQQLPAKALEGIAGTSEALKLVAPPNCDLVGKALDLNTWKFVIYGADGKTYPFDVLPYLQLLGPIAAALLLVQALSFLRFLSDTRRVRRKLQPLNDLAIAAESVGIAAAKTDPMTMSNVAETNKIATLEHAIEAATVDSPTVSTGDQDLRPIEVALNNLLRQMHEAKLQQMRFVSDASHELRTPIAVIQGYVNMLDRWGSSDEEVLTESIEALKAESEHMQELVEQLLFLARGDSGRNTLQYAQLNLAAIVREVEEESSMIDDKHVYRCALTEQDESDERFSFTGDVAMIKQALRILVSNSQRYSDEGTTITLGASAEQDSVTCIVQDEGIGMTEDEVSHTFERFYRSDKARETTTEGTGLGLAIAKWIVDAHGGSIVVLSHVGVGTRFTITLPKRSRQAG